MHFRHEDMHCTPHLKALDFPKHCSNLVVQSLCKHSLHVSQWALNN